MKIIFSAFITALSLTACHKTTIETECPTILKLTANNPKPTVGDNLILYAHNGSCIYNWTGPQNFALQSADGSDHLEFENILIRQSGWYNCGEQLPYCTTLFDSIFIDVQYKQGLPACSLTSNNISGAGVPVLQASNVTKHYGGAWDGLSLYASGIFGYPTYTFLFNSYNGNTEPKDGIYTTVSIQSFNPAQDADVIYIQCQYSNFFFKSQPGQKIYISHVNEKLSIAFCSVDFSGDNGNGNYFTSAFSGKVTEQ